jgi:hypothetical protein
MLAGHGVRTSIATLWRFFAGGRITRKKRRPRRASMTGRPTSSLFFHLLRPPERPNECRVLTLRVDEKPGDPQGKNARTISTDHSVGGGHRDGRAHRGGGHVPVVEPVGQSARLPAM